jgi:Protein of unknown function (DUF998)
MTRGAQPGANPDLQAGNGLKPAGSGTTGRGRAAIWIRAGAFAGVAGPVTFTAAWIGAAFRQPGLAFSVPQISGLAADNARDPWLMLGGFLLLGGCAVGFGAALAVALGGRPRAGRGPAAVKAAGVLTIAAGLLRRDHVLLTAGPESWHNHAHDVVSAAAYVLLIAAPLLLARRFRRDPRWHLLAPPLVTAAIASAALLVAFYAAPHNPWDATLQRIAVSLPLAAVAAVAVRLSQVARADPMSPGDADAGSLPGRPGRSRQPG